MAQVGIVAALLMLVWVRETALAAVQCDEVRKVPLAHIGQALTSEDRTQIRSACQDLLTCKIVSPEAHSHCAERLKGFGDYTAEKHYKKALTPISELDTDDHPRYELLYAQYLRNFRGPLRPLFSEAESHYYAALNKVAQIKKKSSFVDEKWVPTHLRNIQAQVERELMTLYEADGLPLITSKRLGASLRPRPLLFWGSISTFARDTTPLDEIDDARDFTSQMLFATGPERLGIPLRRFARQRLARATDQVDTLQRLRLRYPAWPVLDAFFKYRDIEDGQITDFNRPLVFNDVELYEYGFAIEKPFNLAPLFDAFLRGTLKRIEREGTIEFLPNDTETIHHFEIETVLSRFLGQNRANLALTYAFQDIDPERRNFPQREREILGATLSYHIFDPSIFPCCSRPRSWEWFVGFLYDREEFSNRDVTKYDFFIGTTLRALRKFDITLQSTLLTADVEDVPSQKNKHYRTDFVVGYRIIDEETERRYFVKGRGIHTAFLHLVFPLRHDLAVDGPDDFENIRAGISLIGKFFSKQLRGPTFLVEARYDHQYFYEIEKDLNLFRLSVSMGF
ncbi:hypothetical protein [Candidatus Entotheonella palauensis]|uniref:hypothetical protein n=1 Tax=Candidatus Entotheonella palauensis TaxID=93172 RepID=UPI000B7DB36F|nr:hypothetical protein [Candidatus Entotheonella palauensis]